MTAEAFKRELGDALRTAWPDARAATDLPFSGYWRKTTAWLAFHAPHVGDELMRKLVTCAIAECLEAERSGREPVAHEVPAAVRAIWAELDEQVTTAPQPETHFIAPFSGPRPGILRQGRLL